MDLETTQWEMLENDYKTWILIHLVCIDGFDCLLEKNCNRIAADLLSEIQKPNHKNIVSYSHAICI